MKRFEFNLQSVRDLRDREEGRARAEYAKAMRLMEAFNVRRRDIEQAIKDNLGKSRRKYSKPMRSDWLTRQRELLAALKDRLQSMEPEGLELKKFVDGKWKNLVGARQKREALDKLRDKQQQAHDHQTERNEQLSMDEMASLRATSPRMI